MFVDDEKCAELGLDVKSVERMLKSWTNSPTLVGCVVWGILAVLFWRFPDPIIVPAIPAPVIRVTYRTEWRVITKGEIRCGSVEEGPDQWLGWARWPAISEKEKAR